VSQTQDRLVTVSFKIYASRLAEIDLLCSQLRISRSEFIKRALAEYIEKIKQMNIPPNKKVVKLYRWECPICNEVFTAPYIGTLKAGIVSHLKHKHGVSVDKSNIKGIEKRIIEVI